MWQDLIGALYVVFDKREYGPERPNGGGPTWVQLEDFEKSSK